MLRFAARVLLGTLVFVGILVFAGWLPTAAGLMLTFPALNGLAFYFSPPASIAPMARTMLWMPVLNGGLCALHIGLFLQLGSRGSPEIVAAGLTVLVACLWLAAVAPRFIHEGINPHRQIAYCIATTVVGALLVAVATKVTSAAGMDARTSGAVAQLGAGSLIEALVRNGTKTVLFAVCLSVFLVAGTYRGIPDSIRGILGSLPLVPFGGLLGIAADSQLSVEDRLQIFRAMAVSIWLAPAIAIWFIYGVARVLRSRQSAGSAPVDDLMRLSIIVLGWTACMTSIVLIAYGLRLGQPFK